MYVFFRRDKENIIRSRQSTDLRESFAENKGQAPLYQLRALTKSDTPLYDEKELVFGMLKPGETKSASVPLGFCEYDGRKPGSLKPVAENAKRICKLPADTDTRSDILRVRFFAGHRAAGLR